MVRKRVRTGPLPVRPREDLEPGPGVEGRLPLLFLIGFLVLVTHDLALRERGGAGFILGVSTHDLTQVRGGAGLPVDYIGFGPVLPTRSKAQHEPSVGFAGLSAACVVARHPVVAIGGLDAEGAVRAARNLHGMVIMYADRITNSMQTCIQVTNDRRLTQAEYNREHGITPRSTTRANAEMQLAQPLPKKGKGSKAAIAGVDVGAIDSLDSLRKLVEQTRKAMRAAAADLEFEQAAALRDKVRKLEQLEVEMR